MAVPYSWLPASGNQHINFSLVNNTKMAVDTAIFVVNTHIHPVFNILPKSFSIKKC